MKCNNTCQNPLIIALNLGSMGLLVPNIGGLRRYIQISKYSDIQIFKHSKRSFTFSRPWGREWPRSRQIEDLAILSAPKIETIGIIGICREPWLIQIYWASRIKIHPICKGDPSQGTDDLYDFQNIQFTVMAFGLKCPIQARSTRAWSPGKVDNLLHLILFNNLFFNSILDKCSISIPNCQSHQHAVNIFKLVWVHEYFQFHVDEPPRNQKLNNNKVYNLELLVHARKKRPHTDPVHFYSVWNQDFPWTVCSD